MKTFILALILFSILLICIFINSLYVNSICDSFLALTASLSSQSFYELDPAISELRSKWDNHKGILKISVCLNKVEDIEDLLASLESYAKSENPSEFRRVCDTLAGRFSDLAKFERLNPFTP